MTRPLAVYLDVADPGSHPGPALLEAAGFEVRTCMAYTDAEVVAAGTGATALLTGDAPVSEAALAALDSVRIVATCTVGVDHVDIEAARDRGVWVCNSPAAATEEVAVHALAMLLSLVRHIPGFDRHVRSGGWDYLATGVPRRPSTLTLGIIGMGRVGTHLSALAQPLFGRITGHDLPADAARWPPHVQPLGLDELLAGADLVSLHLPLTPQTERLIDRRRIGLMKPGAIIVNVARGRLIDSGALLEALDMGHIAAAGLDVLEDEPPSPDHPLLTHPNVLLTPHVAFFSAEAERAHYQFQAENVLRWYSTGRPVTPVFELPAA